MRAGDRWQVIARFGSHRDAQTALDELVAAGGRPNEYAVVVLPRTRRHFVLMVVVASALVAVIVLGLALFLHFVGL
jgi:hypothetical protein